MNTTITRWQLTVGALCLSLFLGPAIAEAQRPGPTPNRPQRMQQVRKRVQMLMMWRLTEVLALTTEQATRFFPAFGANRAKMQAVRVNVRKTRQAMRQELNNPAPSAKKLAPLTQQLLRLQNQMHQLKQQRMKKAMAILTPLQQAKLLLFLPRFQRRIRRMMRGNKGPGNRFGPRRMHRRRW